MTMIVSRLMISLTLSKLKLLVLLFCGVIVAVFMTPGALGGSMCAVYLTANMTYLVEQLAVNLLIYLLQRFSY